MNSILPISDIRIEDGPRIGGKAQALSRMIRSGQHVPPAVCLTTDAYNRFLNRSGLRERILLELHRKKFADMRWEEIWDVSLRIRNLFLGKPLPDFLQEKLRKKLALYVGNKPVVVRSSAPDEDSGDASFAGLHVSFVNVQRFPEILKSIRLVWASLWSDAALLYRQELGLSVEKSAMAVVIQEMVSGRSSGVAFGRDPVNPSRGVIEAVHGLNQGLVDGKIEPDRWFFDPAHQTITDFQPAHRTIYMVPGESGIEATPLPAPVAAREPVSEKELQKIMQTVLELEQHFKQPQDMEWTFGRNTLYVLQSRPITTLKESSDNQRSWYLSLRKSYSYLKRLRRKIEDDYIPRMVEASTELSAIRLEQLSDSELAKEIRRRYRENEKWVDIYWKKFIPFAHGVRLFGEFYNDTIQPEDPYEFTNLLTGTAMVGMQRNRMLEEMADIIRQNPQLREVLENGSIDSAETAFQNKLEAFVERFGDLTCQVTGASHCTQGDNAILTFLLELAGHPPLSKTQNKNTDAERRRQHFLDRFDGEKRREAAEMLDLARASQRLRDDDNIHLGRIEAQLISAIQEARERLDSAEEPDPELAKAAALLPLSESATDVKGLPEQEEQKIKSRQLVGQPAGPGLARGPARVIHKASDLTGFKKGEILICDGVDPNMTFAVPLAGGVVERRGGMLIHGAIIAREYGLPCITGVPEVTSWIKTGDTVTVDGYLGIVTIGE